MSTIQEITEEIHGENGIHGLQKAARQFEQHSVERDILEHSLSVYRTGLLKKQQREVTVKYADADFCLFQLDEHEDEPLVYSDRQNSSEIDNTVPTWWLLGTDDLRESGLTLMEYPGETDTIDKWTRNDILDGLGLDGWQTVSREQIADLDYDTDYRLSGRLGIKRLEPNEYLNGLQESGIDVDWDEIERFRDTSATRIASHLLAFEDASDIALTFDPLRDLDSGEFVPRGFSESAYVTEGTSVCIVSEQYQNRYFELGEGVYHFPKIGIRQRHTACHPSYEPLDTSTTNPSHDTTKAPSNAREFLVAVHDSFRAWRSNNYST